MTAQTTATLVGEVVSALVDTERFLAHDDDWATALFAIATEAALGDGTSKARSLPLQPLNNNRVRQIVFTAQDVATRRVWQQHRTAYDIDPALWEELGEVDEDMVLPGSVFQHLPHPDPFLAIPDRPTYALADGNTARTVGCFITGRSGARVPAPDEFTGPHTALGWPLSTHSPHAEGGLVVTIMSEVLDRRTGRPRRVPHMGNVPDCLIARVTFNLRGEVRVGDLIDEIAARYDSGQEGDIFNATVRPMLRRIIAALLYLCATNADLRPLPAPAARRAVKGGGRPAKPPKVVTVGYTVGAGLRAWHKARSDAERATGGTGRHVRPHVRRAHPHLYLTGPGRTVPRVRWVWPVRVNVHLQLSTTVHPIRKQKANTP